MANSKDTILNLFPDNNNNEITASKIRQFVSSIFDEKIDINEIQNRLTSTDTDKPLSANMGRVLSERDDNLQQQIDGKENSLPNGNAGDILVLDPNGNKVWEAPTVYNETIVYDGLDSSSSIEALSANMGRELDNKIQIQANINTAQDTLISALENRATVNEADILQNKTDISQNASDIAQNRTDINQNIIRINDNRADIVSANQRISQNITDITQNASDITALRSSLDATNINVSTNTSNIAQNTANISQNIGDISTLQTLVGWVNIPNLQAQVSANTADISGLQGIVSGYTGMINANTSAIQANTNAIQVNKDAIVVLDTRVTSNDSDITNLQNVDAQQQTEIDDLESRVTQNENDIAVNATNITANANAISINTNNINSNVTNIANNRSDIVNLRTDLDTQGIRITTNETNIADNVADIESNRLNILRLGQDLENTDTTVAQMQVQINSKEAFLGLPPEDGMVLASMTNGTRMWVENQGSGSGNITVIDHLNGVGLADDALSANQGYILNQKVISKEEYLGLPYMDNMVLTSTSSGNRIWKDPRILKIDYGVFYGAGNRIVSATITPSDATYFESSQPVQLIAIATRAGGQVEDITTRAVWSTNNTAILTVSDTGVIVPTGTAYGTAIVTAEIDDGSGSNVIVATANITIEQVLITDLTLTPADAVVGQNVTIHYVATATNNDGSTEDVTQLCDWSINDPSIATILNAYPDKGTVITNNSFVTGTAHISATIDNGAGTDILGTTSLSVTTS